jgi:hypothetical protein
MPVGQSAYKARVAAETDARLRAAADRLVKSGRRRGTITRPELAREAGVCRATAGASIARQRARGEWPWDFPVAQPVRCRERAGAMTVIVREPRIRHPRLIGEPAPHYRLHPDPYKPRPGAPDPKAEAAAKSLAEYRATRRRAFP